MTDRERMIKLLLKIKHQCDRTACDECYYKMLEDCFETLTADYLLDSGVNFMDYDSWEELK